MTRIIVLYVKNSWLREKRLLEFGHHLVHLIVRVGAVAGGIYGFPTEVAGDPLLVEEWTL